MGCTWPRQRCTVKNQRTRNNMRCPRLFAALSRSRGATERPESCPATIPGDNTVFDASPLQVLTGENLKQRHARTPRPETAAPKSNPGSPEQRHARIPRPDAAAPKSNPGSPYQRHEGIPRPDAAAPNPAAGGICFAARVGHGVGLLLFFNAVAVMLGSSWPGLLVPVAGAEPQPRLAGMPSGRSPGTPRGHLRRHRRSRRRRRRRR